MDRSFHPLADLIAPSAWVTWFTIHSMQVHSVLQDLALLAAIFASVGAGLYHLTRWVRMIRGHDDQQPKD